MNIKPRGGGAMSSCSVPVSCASNVASNPGSPCARFAPAPLPPARASDCDLPVSNASVSGSWPCSPCGSAFWSKTAGDTGSVDPERTSPCSADTFDDALISLSIVTCPKQASTSKSAKTNPRSSGNEKKAEHEKISMKVQLANAHRRTSVPKINASLGCVRRSLRLEPIKPAASAPF